MNHKLQASISRPSKTAPRAIVVLASTFCVLASAFALPLVRDSLPNGLAILTYEDNRLPIVDIAVVCRSAAAEDPTGKEGTAHLVANLLLRGDATRNADSVADILGFLGAQANANADYDRTSITLRCLAKDLEQALDVIADAVLRPAFDQKEFERAQNQELSQARRSLDSPGGLLGQTFRRLLFGAHRYALPANGDTGSLARLTREDLISFHRVHYRPNNCFVVAVGDFDRDRLLQSIERRFGSWEPAAIPLPDHPRLCSPPGLRVKLVTRPEMNQTYIEFGHPGISVFDDDMLATRLMSFILGGSPKSSRMGNSVREEGGLAYDVRCWFDRMELPGAFHATVQTTKPALALKLMFDAVKAVHSAGCRAEELRTAHNYFTGSFPLTYSSNSGKLGQLVTQELYGFGDDWLERFPSDVRGVTLEQVNRAGRNRLSPGNYLLVIVGPVTKDDLDLPDAEWIE